MQQAPQSEDEKYLQRAIELSAEHMRANHGGPFGAIIVTSEEPAGDIVAEGHNQVPTANDPTAHAEVVAIREACSKLGTYDLSGHVIYSSCEPCPMCLAAIYWARLDRLVFANSREDAFAIGFGDRAIYDEMGKGPEARSLPTTHLPLASARGVFQEWVEKPDKVRY